MSCKIEYKLVIGIASSALFELDEADTVYQTEGVAAYRKYQREHQYDVLKSGVAFPFIKRLLMLNVIFPELEPVEVVLLSHNDSDTGLRVFNSIKHYDLNITRAAFTTGDSPFKYIPAYNVSLFLSASEADVQAAINAGHAAGQVLHSAAIDDTGDHELRIAFDFDGVLADDSAEQVYKTRGIDAFAASETAKAKIPHTPGPLANLFAKLAQIHELEDERESAQPGYKRYLKTSIVTARSAPAHERVVTTLRNWNIRVDQTFFLGGINKGRIMETLRPHIFFDDQLSHLLSTGKFTPAVHIPFGVANSMKDTPSSTRPTPAST